jgi:DNA-binding protein HU-beta
MQKSDLIEKISDEAGISKAAAYRALNSLLTSITKALKKGDRISLVGFGTFSVSKRTARMGRNPQTGEAIKIKAAKVPKFSAGKTLKEAVKKK